MNNAHGTESPYYFPGRARKPGKGLVRTKKQAVNGPMALPPLPTASGLSFLRPGDASYDVKLTCYNKRTLLRPLLLAMCGSTEAVVAMVSWVRTHSLAFAVRSGGHSFEGLSNSTSVVIDLRDLKSIVFDAASGEVTVGAGAILGDIYKAVAARGAAFVGGTCPFVGVGGHVLGGGYGFLARAYGLACDNLKSATLVDAQARQLTVSSHVNPDLFWACRGAGGGSFGIVTQFTFATHRLSNVRVLSAVWELPRDRALRIIRAWQQWAPAAPKAITSLINVGKLPSGFFRIKCAGQSIGPESEVSEALHRLAAVEAPKSSFVVTKSFIEAVKAFAGGWTPETGFYKERSDMTPALSDKAILTLLDQLTAIPSAHVVVLISAYGGAINDVANTGTAFPHRSGIALCLHYYSQWSAASETNPRVARTARVFDAMRPHVPGGAYVNYSDLQLGNFENAYWGSNLPRLKAIKRQVDPANMFRHPQSVRPV